MSNPEPSPVTVQQQSGHRPAAALLKIVATAPEVALKSLHG